MNPDYGYKELMGGEMPAELTLSEKLKQFKKDRLMKESKNLVGPRKQKSNSAIPLMGMPQIPQNMDGM